MRQHPQKTDSIEHSPLQLITDPDTKSVRSCLSARSSVIHNQSPTTTNSPISLHHAPPSGSDASPITPCACPSCIKRASLITVPGEQPDPTIDRTSLPSPPPFPISHPLLQQQQQQILSSGASTRSYRTTASIHLDGAHSLHSPTTPCAPHGPIHPAIHNLNHGHHSRTPSTSTTQTRFVPIPTADWSSTRRRSPSTTSSVVTIFPDNASMAPSSHFSTHATFGTAPSVWSVPAMTIRTATDRDVEEFIRREDIDSPPGSSDPVMLLPLGSNAGNNTVPGVLEPIAYEQYLHGLPCGDPSSPASSINDVTTRSGSGVRDPRRRHHNYNHRYRHTDASGGPPLRYQDADATTIRTVNTNFTTAQGTARTDIGSGGGSGNENGGSGRRRRRRRSLSHASANSRHGGRFFSRTFIIMAAGLLPIASWGNGTGGAEGRGLVGYPANGAAWAMYRSWNLCQLFYTLPLIVISMVTLVNHDTICDFHLYIWLVVQACIFYLQLACCIYILIRHSLFRPRVPTLGDATSINSARRAWWAWRRRTSPLGGPGSVTNVPGEEQAESAGEEEGRRRSARRTTVVGWNRYLLSPFFYSRLIMAAFVMWSVVGVALVGWDGYADECSKSNDTIYLTSYNIIFFHISVIGLYCILWCFIPCLAIIWLHALPSNHSVPTRAATKEMIERLQCRRGLDMAWFDRPGDESRLDIEDEIDESCAICLGDYEPTEWIRILPCTHYFHKNCIDQWLLTDKSCPLCKHDIDQPWPPLRNLAPSTHQTMTIDTTRTSRSNSMASNLNLYGSPPGGATPGVASTIALTALTGYSVEAISIATGVAPVRADLDGAAVAVVEDGETKDEDARGQAAQEVREVEG